MLEPEAEQAHSLGEALAEGPPALITEHMEILTLNGQ
jgi:hypothetical protein